MIILLYLSIIDIINWLSSGAAIRIRSACVMVGKSDGHVVIYVTDVNIDDQNCKLRSAPCTDTERSASSQSINH
jgi:hypothetical protein